jgi:NAD(P)H dehydrogenase (quinone)
LEVIALNTTKINVIFHSIHGHIYKLALAEAEGAKSVEGVEVKIYRVPETLSREILEKMKAVESVESFSYLPVADLKTLSEADGLIFGTPTRFGMMTSQMRNYLDSTGSLWSKAILVGKPATVFTSTSTQHGGQEAAILSFHTTLLHHGMILLGLPYVHSEMFEVEKVSGGGPYGASTLTGSDGRRQPSEAELKLAFEQGKYLATIASRLKNK